MIANQNFCDTCFTIFYPTASATVYGRSFSGPNIRLRPKVKIVPTVQHCKVKTQQQKIVMWTILFLCYEESLVSSNLNSKLFRFHCVRPNVDIMSMNLALANFLASFFLRIMWRFRLTFKVKPSRQGMRKKE